MEKKKSFNRKPVKLLLEIILNRNRKKVQSIPTANLDSNVYLDDIRNSRDLLLTKSSTKIEEVIQNSKEKVIKIKIKLNISDLSESDFNESFTSDSSQNQRTAEVETITRTLNLSTDNVTNEEKIYGTSTRRKTTSRVSLSINDENNVDETIFFDVIENEKSEKNQNVAELDEEFELTASHNQSMWQKIFEKIQNKCNSSSEDKRVVNVIHELIIDKYKQVLNGIKQRIDKRGRKTIDITTTTTLEDSKDDNLDCEKSFSSCRDKSYSDIFKWPVKQNAQKKGMLVDDVLLKRSTFPKKLKSKLRLTRSLDNVIEYDEYFLDSALGKELRNATFESQSETSLYDTSLIEKEMTTRSETDQMSISSSKISLLISETDCRRPMKIYNNYENLDNLLINHKSHNLMKKYAMQNEIIQQSSKAVTICRMQPNFFGKDTLVEAEKILLVTGLRKEAIENELRNLDYEDIDPQLTSCTVKISNIEFYTKSCAFEQNRNYRWYYVCVLHQGSTVYSTKTFLRLENKIRFDDSFSFENIFSEFQINVSIYALLQKNGKDKKLKPKTREELKSVPSACYTSTRSYFILWGTSTIRPSQSHQTFFNLSKVPLEAPITSAFRTNIDTSFKIHIRTTGYLTLGIDYKGCPVWNRRWCILNGSILKYWNHPNEEETCAPLGEINLKNCVSYELRRAEKEICPSPRTLLLHMNVIQNGKKVQQRYFLSADNYVDFDRWIRELNIVLYYLRKWSNYISFLKH